MPTPGEMGLAPGRQNTLVVKAAIHCNYVADLLGHTSILSTAIYARITSHSRMT
jgi:site-specific recombinase XerD